MDSSTQTPKLLQNRTGKSSGTFLVPRVILCWPVSLQCDRLCRNGPFSAISPSLTCSGIKSRITYFLQAVLINYSIHRKQVVGGKTVSIQVVIPVVNIMLKLFSPDQTPFPFISLSAIQTSQPSAFQLQRFELAYVVLWKPDNLPDRRQ